MLSIRNYLPYNVQNCIRRLRKSAQKPLYKRLPLALPDTIHIDPCNRCNFQCVFCPTGDRELLASVNRYKGTMPFEVFCKIIDDCDAMVRASGSQLRQLHLYKDGEPLLNDRFVDMAAYAKRKNIARNVSTTTNGSLLTEEISLGLVRSGIDTVRISVEQCNDEGYKAVTKTYGDFEGLKNKIAFLYHAKRRNGNKLRVVVKINDMNLSEYEKKRFFDQFKPISDEIKIDTLMGWSSSDKKDFTLGASVKTAMDGITPLTEKIVCPEPFRTLAINPNATVSVCCVDWAYATVVGDASKQTVSDIWRGQRLKEFRLTHAQGKRRELSACANCQYILGFRAEDSLDIHREKLNG